MTRDEQVDVLAYYDRALGTAAENFALMVRSKDQEGVRVAAFAREQLERLLAKRRDLAAQTPDGVPLTPPGGVPPWRLL